MGECTYYLKAVFPHETDTVKLAEEIIDFLAESQVARDYWYTHAGRTDPGGWDTIQRRFPQVWDYLDGVMDLYSDPPRSLRGGNHISLGMTGLLNLVRWIPLPTDEEIRKQAAAEAGLMLSIRTTGSGQELRYFAENIWHLADWDPFCAYLRRRWGAIGAGWVTDEDDIDYFKVIDLT